MQRHGTQGTEPGGMARGAGCGARGAEPEGAEPEGLAAQGMQRPGAQDTEAKAQGTKQGGEWRAGCGSGVGFCMAGFWMLYGIWVL